VRKVAGKTRQGQTFKMVKVSIVDEKESGNSPYASSSSSRTSSSESLASVSSESPDTETLYERVVALVDIVPPQTRYRLSTGFTRSRDLIQKGGKVIGNIVWVLTTSALLVGLPLILILEDEAKIVNEERNVLAQQQGAQQVRPG
jgi:mitochondrial import receptor subunit TOM22